MNHKRIVQGMRRIELLFIFLPAIIALVISVAWLINSGKAWQAQQIERLLTNGQQVSPVTLIQTLEKAHDLDKAFIPGSHLHLPALLAANLSEEWDPGDEVENKILSDARESAKRALAREPADAVAWAQLAFFRYILDGPSPETLAALRMSIYTAPSRPWLIFWRLEMAAYNGDFWDEQMIDLVIRQILLGWVENPVMLVQTAISHGLVPITQEILSADQEQLSQLETLIAGQESP